MLSSAEVSSSSPSSDDLKQSFSGNEQSDAPQREVIPGPLTVDGAGSVALEAIGATRIADHILGDEPAAEARSDRLGFQPYVRAVAKFLTDPSTKIPITMSIEGVWGSGKSSFMLLLQEQLRIQGKSRIVAFNAWQYNGDEGLWAAFLNEFDTGLRKNLTLREGFIARFRLVSLRLKWQDWLLSVRALLWMGATLFVLLWMLRFAVHGGLSALTRAASESGKWNEAVGKTLALVGGAGGTVAAILLFLGQFKEMLKSPATMDQASRAWSRPKYDDRLPLIHQTVKEFKDLAAAYAGGDDVYVFVDDLDRCEHAKAAELMQMLLTLLSNAPKIILILGIDRDKVAAAMAARQEKLLPYLYRVQPSAMYELGISYGQRFLEKFIQVNYVLPVPGTPALKAMINPNSPPPKAPLVDDAIAAAAIQIVTGKDDSGTLDDLIDMGSEAFAHNPRNVKQFVNMFRLQAFIANETGLFISGRVMKDKGDRLSIPQLAKFVALCMRWPEVVENAIIDEELISDLEQWSFATQDLKKQIQVRRQVWLRDRGLVTLLGFKSGDITFNLSRVNLQMLMMVAPARVRDQAPVAAESETGDVQSPEANSSSFLFSNEAGPAEPSATPTRQRARRRSGIPLS